MLAQKKTLTKKTAPIYSKTCTYSTNIEPAATIQLVRTDRKTIFRAISGR